MENMGRIVRRRLKDDTLHPFQVEKFGSAYSKSTYGSVKKISERMKKQHVPEDALVGRGTEKVNFSLF